LKSSIIDLFRQARKPKDIKFRNQLYVFLICLVISVFVWFLISLSQVYVSEVKYQLDYKNIPDDRILSGEGNKDVHLRVRSQGFSLFSMKYLTIRNPITVDLDELYIRKDRKSGKNYFLTNQVRQQIISQLDATDQLLTITPDTIFFGLDKVINVEVPVISNLSIQYSKQFQLYDSIQINPGTVTIRGPESMIDTIDFILTEKKSLTDINQNTTLALKIEQPLKTNLVTYSAEEVELSILVEEFTEAVLERPIEIQGLNSGMRIKTFPEFVKVTYKVALKDYQRVDPLMFKIFAAPDTLLESSNAKIRITRTECPPFVKITKIDPQELDFIILE